MYINHARIPRIRMEAVRLHALGWSTRKVARHFGFTQSAVVKWVKKAKNLPSNAQRIETRSSRPDTHPNELSPDIVEAILAYRVRYARGAEVLQYLLRKDGVEVSVSSVKRVIQRNEMSSWSKWKKRHTYPVRPLPSAPGMLVQMDTVHTGPHTDRLYLYTGIDVYSRVAFVVPCQRISAARSVRFVQRAQHTALFTFGTVQTDHGSEFSKWFTEGLGRMGIAHRHSRVRTPNDNAHVERFNRTIQEECIARCSRSLRSWQKEIPEYLHWYNEERPHLALQMRTPAEMLRVIPRC